MHVNISWENIRLFVCLFIVCLTAHRQLGHIGPTLGVDALSRHAQDVGIQIYMGSMGTELLVWNLLCGPSRRLAPTTAQLAPTSTAEWRASTVKLSRNGPNVSRRRCYHHA